LLNFNLEHFYKSCRLCPRSCGINRAAGEKGFCKETAALRIASVVLHLGEEPPIAGAGGSGTIFISGCNLGCAFCQNHQISQGNGSETLGREVSAGEFAEICLKLQARKAENINIVTGSHAIPAIVQGIIAARNNGSKIPVLWNSSAYENTEALELLKGHIDIFLPDLKTLDRETAAKFFGARDYPDVASQAILKMTSKKKEKVIIRHLILPGCLESTRSVLRWFAENVKDKALLSLMTQYTPVKAPYRKEQIPERYLQSDEYNTILGWLEEFGIEEGFCQELVTGSDWLTDFTKYNPFPSALSVPIWHLTEGCQ
jgi:putative pyruvate formate lyase activating enzyme